MQWRNHVQSQLVKRFKQYKQDIKKQDIKFGMLQVHENEISLRK